MSAVSDAYNLLCAENPMGFNPDYVCKLNIPDKMPDDVKKEDVPVLVLIKDIQSIPGAFASNQSRMLANKVQVQVWFSPTDPLAEQYEELLRKYMESNGFYAYYIFTDMDPDISKLFLTAKFNCNQFD
ncbi:hypothetical protein PU629_07255 [Pullulanibacillus sp. KACC 23026]|uniref:hypothetical protein n=1 Tax=Pullulanibacillus sp. KACC 23026 TaxID=3028315 RepID=UPI0023B1CC06|nr:hypothetical protein [Pullulanibacillus sp. KACC 23026]WEG14154.1 hypothetical protein PU629_07255 [Pullulanibacillus sp. KACC 23026]